MIISRQNQLLMANYVNAKARIIFVSKDIVCFLMIEKLFSRLGWELICKDEIDNLNQIVEGYPSVAAIIIDGALLSDEHEHLIRWLRQLHHETVLILTDHFSTTMLSKAIHFGFDEFVAKPFNTAQIKLILERKLLHTVDE
jgi:DNA-binding NtrC family response regulator